MISSIGFESKFLYTCAKTLSAPPSSALGSTFEWIKYKDVAKKITATVIGSNRMHKLSEYLLGLFYSVMTGGWFYLSEKNWVLRGLD